MKLYFVYNDTISSVKYRKVTEDLTTPSTKIYFKVPSAWNSCYVHTTPDEISDNLGDELHIGDSGYYEWDISALINSGATLINFQLVCNASTYMATSQTINLAEDRGGVYELISVNNTYTTTLVDSMPGTISVENVTATVGEDSSGPYVDIPDDVLNSTNTYRPLLVTVNDTWTIPVILNDSTWLDEINVDAYINNNSYVANVSQRAQECVKYKDLYVILRRMTESTIDRIHEVLGY